MKKVARFLFLYKSSFIFFRSFKRIVKSFHTLHESNFNWSDKHSEDIWLLPPIKDSFSRKSSYLLIFSSSEIFLKNLLFIFLDFDRFRFTLLCQRKVFVSLRPVLQFFLCFSGSHSTLQSIPCLAVYIQMKKKMAIFFFERWVSFTLKASRLQIVLRNRHLPIATHQRNKINCLVMVKALRCKSFLRRELIPLKINSQDLEILSHREKPNYIHVLFHSMPISIPRTQEPQISPVEDCL
jgi:hypothetical protein